MKKNLLLKVVAVALVVLAFISCKQEVQPTGVKLNQTTLALETGATANLIATVEPAGAVGSVSWSSTNDVVASVADGVVTAKSAGSATITAKISTFSATCTVTVSDPYVKVTSVTLDKTSLDLVEGDAAQLTATVAPDNATDKTVTWKSSDTKVATVSASGEVAAVAEGKATITATAGDASASCEVAVAKKVIAVESVTLDRTSLELTEGGTATLTATVLPDNATDKTVTWTSDNTAVATVADGVVTAVAEGTAKITAKAGDASAVCTVSVKKKVIAVESVTLDKTAVELTEGETATLTATVKPDNATDKTVTWSCDNTAVATVADGVITAKAEGTAKVTAKAGDVTAVCTVTVKKKFVAVESVTLDKTAVELTEGETAALTATVKPDDATDKTVTWTSDTPAVATVADGVITAVAEGIAKITAKAGDASAVCTVTVKKKIIAVESVTLDKNAMELKVGGTGTLTATVLPDNATDKTVTWSSDNTAVATVADGVVTGVAEGTAKVTAKAGDASAVCTVTVKKEVVKVTEITIGEADFELEIGETKSLTVTVKPDNATDKSVTWTSDKPGIASVNSDGVVTAVAAGSAKITVKANGGDVSDFVNVTVTAGGPKFEDWLGTWSAKSGVKKNTLEITAIETTDGGILENMYFVFGWQKFENVPFFGAFSDGDLAFVGGPGMLIAEDEVLFQDDPEAYDLMVVGWFKYNGSEYFLTDDDPYIMATGTLDGKKSTMEATSFELEGETCTFTKMEFLVQQKTGADAGAYYRITNENPLPFPVKLTKSSSGAPAKAKSAVKSSGVKFEKIPVNEFAFKR